MDLFRIVLIRIDNLVFIVSSLRSASNLLQLYVHSSHKTYCFGEVTKTWKSFCDVVNLIYNDIKIAITLTVGNCVMFAMILLLILLVM